MVCVRFSLLSPNTEFLLISRLFWPLIDFTFHLCGKNTERKVIVNLSHASKNFWKRKRKDFIIFFLFFFFSTSNIWVNVFKYKPRKICGRQPWKNLKLYGLPWSILESIHCVRIVHFPVFRLNTEKYGLSLRIQSAHGKMRENTFIL